MWDRLTASQNAALLKSGYSMIFNTKGNSLWKVLNFLRALIKANESDTMGKTN